MGWVKTVLAAAAVVGLILGPRLLRRSDRTRAADAVTLVILSPHHEAIIYEFGAGFSEWHQRHYGHPVDIDWRNVGNTGQISRYVASKFEAAFEDFYRNRHGGRRIPIAGWDRPSRQSDPGRRALAEQIRGELLAPENAAAIGIGVDVIFGGGPFEHEQWRRAGYSVPLRVDPAILKGIPQQWAGTDYYYIDERPGEQRRGPQFDPAADWREQDDGYWYGAALSGFGIVFNRVALAAPQVRLGDPRHWPDLAHPRLYRWVELADPRSSGSTTKGFEMILQTEMAAASAPVAPGGAAPAAPDPAALERGWREGLNLIKRMGANARFFAQSSTRVPLDVSSRDAAAGMAIDFYGRFQSEYVGGGEVGYVSPPGGTMLSPDPICLLRGAPNRDVAARFIEYVLSIDGQMLWDLPTGFVDPATGRRGPLRTTNRRMSIRPDVYRLYGRYLKNQDNPFDSSADLLDYRPEYSARLFTVLRVLIGAMCVDTHDELCGAWEAVKGGAAPEALEAFDWLPIGHAEALLLSGATDEQIRALYPGWLPSPEQQRLRGAIDDGGRREAIARQWLDDFRARYGRTRSLADRDIEAQVSPRGGR